jgi:hypothetical protein
MQHSSSYTSKVTGKQYKIVCTVICKSANVIYILECSVCGLQYFGESKQPFHKRLNGHRSDLAKKTFLPVSQHFRLSDHRLEDFNRMKILIIEQNCLWSDFRRENRERIWNKELVFYIRTVLTENNSFLCIFSFRVFIVNEYFTTVTNSQMRHPLPGDNYTILYLQWNEGLQDL